MRILELSKERGLTQKDLAEKIGLTPVGLSKSINGNPTIGTLQKIADALEVPITELFEQSTKGETIGIIRHKGKSHEINSIEDIKKLLTQIEENK